MRQRLCMVSPACRLVKHIEGWLDCTGQLPWRKDVPPCQTHRCRVMSHCVLEFCQKCAFLFCSLVFSLIFSHLLHLSVSLSCSFSLYCVSLCIFTLIRLEFYLDECLPCLCLFPLKEWHQHSVQMSTSLSLVTTWYKVKFNNVRLHKAAAKGNISKGHRQG